MQSIIIIFIINNSHAFSNLMQVNHRPLFSQDICIAQILSMLAQ